MGEVNPSQGSQSIDSVIERLRKRADWQRENLGDMLDRGEAWPELEQAADMLEALTLSPPEAEMADALRALLAEFAKFSRYGSPMAMKANEAVQNAKRVLATKEQP